MNEPAHPLIEHFFRKESANLVSVLTRAFGVRRLDMIEDMVQVAMLEAMNAWKHRGVPDNPSGWIHQKAKHRILDAIRREKTFARALADSGRGESSQDSLVDTWLLDEHLPDSQLRMMFVCCHPSLDRQSQISLTLKTLCGLGISEISRGLLLSSEAVKKRIQRSKASLAAANVSLEIPAPDQLQARRSVVHDVLYLMFNEGYSTSRGSEPIRDDICEDAARLCHLLCNSEFAAPETKALLALLLFQSARLDARTDGDGEVVLLEDQDRTRWDQCLIRTATQWLAQSAGERPTTFHLEAAIAMQHCMAASVESTDWPTIVRLYDRLIELRDSPIYRLNQAIAIGQAGDSDGARSRLLALKSDESLQDYLLLDCALARIHELNGDMADAMDGYLLALSKASVSHQKTLVQKKLQRLTG